MLDPKKTVLFCTRNIVLANLDPKSSDCAEWDCGCVVVDFSVVHAVSLGRIIVAEPDFGVLAWTTQKGKCSGLTA